jgi:hypothetical protein
MHVFCMKRDGKKRSDLTTGIALSNCYKRWPSGGLGPLYPPTRARWGPQVALRPLAEVL